MKMNKLIPVSLTLLAGIFVLSISSCKKEEVVPAPNPSVVPETFASLDDYLQTRVPISEDFEILAQTGATLATPKGSIITIPVNAFTTASGQPVTGTVTIRMKEIFSNADMMFSRIFPISNSNVLNSGGEFFIEATQNGNTLIVADGVFIEVDIPAQAPDNQMMLFLAGPVEALDTANWQVADSINTQSGFGFNSADNTYELDLDTLGWGNIDAFTSVNYFDCVFNLTGLTGLDATNTTAFAVFKDQNTVWPVGTLYWGDITNGVITETHLADVPLNLVVISVVNGQLHYGLLDVTPQQGTTYSIPLIETTSANLDQIISSLP